MQTTPLPIKQNNRYENFKHKHCLMNKKLPLPFRGIKIYTFLLAVLLLTWQLQVFAQNTKNVITGTVKDNNGKPLVGVLVKVKKQ